MIRSRVAESPLAWRSSSRRGSSHPDSSSACQKRSASEIGTQFTCFASSQRRSSPRSRRTAYSSDGLYTYSKYGASLPRSKKSATRSPTFTSELGSGTRNLLQRVDAPVNTDCASCFRKAQHPDSLGLVEELRDTRGVEKPAAPDRASKERARRCALLVLAKR